MNNKWLIDIIYWILQYIFFFFNMATAYVVDYTNVNCKGLYNTVNEHKVTMKLETIIYELHK